jgi:transcriptional regulator with XRE-family HTH domain
MVRARLSPEAVARGVNLGRLLRRARGERTAVEIASRAGVSVETVRKVEHGLVPTPTFFTVAALAHACGIRLDELAAELGRMDEISAARSA